MASYIQRNTYFQTYLKSPQQSPQQSFQIYIDQKWKYIKKAFLYMEIYQKWKYIKKVFLYMEIYQKYIKFMPPSRPSPTLSNYDHQYSFN
tara:strand:- start:102 stop:371 length:270 start_codon:yes stop_codon:yes gene_type:complete